MLHEGQVAEMRTGEGKTLVATLPAYVNALTGVGWCGSALRWAELLLGGWFELKCLCCCPHA